MPFALRIPDCLGNVGERSISVVVIQNILAALQSRRPAGDHHAFVEARTGFGHGRRGQIEIDVVGDEQIELPVAIVVDEGAASVPALAFARHASLLADIGERAVAVVVIQNVLAEVGDEQIVPAVVVVVADANALSPARVRDSGLRGDVGKCAVAIVAEQMRRRFAARRESPRAACRSPERCRAIRRCRNRRRQRRSRWFRARYLFLCSPPKMVFAFSPDSRATLRKLTPRSRARLSASPSAASAFCCALARNQRGRAIASTLSSESTSAERLRDFRKTRREGNKRSLPGPLGSC